MAITKCPECRKSVSDSNKTCPYCGANTDTKIYCPRCNSTDIKLSVHIESGFASIMTKLLFGWFFGAILSGKSKSRIRCYCNQCGRRFKTKK